MCYERWARRRDEAVESRWLLELSERDRQDATASHEREEQSVGDPPGERELLTASEL
jgi:hypothetical protein